MAGFENKFKKETGTTFCKLLGCGADSGFSLAPDFSQYVLLNCWRSESDAESGFKNSDSFGEYLSRSGCHQHIYMKTVGAHGKWNGVNPFVAVSDNMDNNTPVAVLTRATIKWNEVFRFRKFVMPVVKNMFKLHNPVFAVGVGEFPLRYQATFSIWPSFEAMKSFAYSDAQHLKVIRETQKSGWYSEDLFARFKIYNTSGKDLTGIHTGLKSN